MVLLHWNKTWYTFFSFFFPKGLLNTDILQKLIQIVQRMFFSDTLFMISNPIKLPFCISQLSLVYYSSVLWLCAPFLRIQSWFWGLGEAMIPEIQASLEVVRTWKWGKKDKRFIHGKVIQGTDIPVSLRSDRWSLLLTLHTQGSHASWAQTDRRWVTETRFQQPTSMT